MESVLPTSNFDLKTLNPPPTKSSIFSSYTPRRIHLESSSYRSLLHILSHCLNHSLLPPSPVLAALNLCDFDDKEIESGVDPKDLHNVMLECGRLIDEAEVEEGEISGDAQDLEGLIDVNDRDKVLEDQKKEGTSRDEFKEVGVNLFDTSEEENQNKQKVVEARKNRKNCTLTEKRKAKKKIAKKRKRAQKNREQGVKKLKIHSIVKPKEVKYCNFYKMGRCHQGNLCKFSHDTTPLTKSMPCKHFACNSCLKGDDCPYDHELSKYPCLNHMSTGNCYRGDGCKFSHKIPTTDSACQSTVSKIDLQLTSKQPNLRNQSIGVHASPLDISSFEGKTKEAPPLLKASQVPKGIRFLSFGTGKTDLSNKAKECLPVNKHDHTGAYNHQRQDDILVHGHRSALTLTWNSLSPQKSMKSSGLAGDVSSNGFTIKDSGNVTKGSANHEVSEASKILEEFLFCGAS